jgi:hypothetical protein
MVEELEPVRQAIFEAQTAYGQTRWNEHLAVDLRLAGVLGSVIYSSHSLQAAERPCARVGVYVCIGGMLPVRLCAKQSNAAPYGRHSCRGKTWLVLLLPHDMCWLCCPPCFVNVC